ncbi:MULTISPECIES: hypothetical protein [Chryseobacterium]|uniref:hypothetical protein n=1 Tax=Chryseobacterium TaxID=59732 RepID=UPI0039855881
MINHKINNHFSDFANPILIKKYAQSSVKIREISGLKMINHKINSHFSDFANPILIKKYAQSSVKIREICG